MANPRLLRRRDVPDWPLRRWVRWRYCWWLPLRSELRAAYFDTRAWMGGWCNHCPQDHEPGGGYRHWRCQKRRGHVGLHRTINYVWTDDGLTDYLPLPLGRTDQRLTSPWSRRDRSGSYRSRMRKDAEDRRREKARVKR